MAPQPWLICTIFAAASVIAFLETGGKGSRVFECCATPPPTSTSMHFKLPFAIFFDQNLARSVRRMQWFASWRTFAQLQEMVPTETFSIFLSGVRPRRITSVRFPRNISEDLKTSCKVLLWFAIFDIFSGPEVSANDNVYIVRVRGMFYVNKVLFLQSSRAGFGIVVDSRQLRLNNSWFAIHVTNARIRKCVYWFGF